MELILDNTVFYNFLLQVVIVDFRISLFSKPNNYSSAVIWDGSSKIFSFCVVLVIPKIVSGKYFW
jgi:hypothetical protein